MLSRETNHPRINWPFAIIALIAISAVLGRFVLVHHYEVPRLFRHHLADFGFAGLFTFVLTSMLAPLRRRRPPKRQQAKRKHDQWLAIPAIGTLIGLWIELEDYFGFDDDEGGFDPGVITEWLGAPNTDTFDPMDLLAISLGGVVVILLQNASVKNINHWRKLPLLLQA